MDIKKICDLIEECFELPVGTVTAEMVSGDIPDWDSLGHFALLEFVESKYPGSIDNNPGLAQASTILELHELGLKNIN
jgi:hypothetical protein